MPPKFFERTKTALVVKSALFEQTDVAVNTNLTSTLLFVFLKHTYLHTYLRMPFDTVFNSILISF